MTDLATFTQLERELTQLERELYVCEEEYAQKRAVPVIGFFYSAPAWKRFYRAHRAYMRVHYLYIARIDEFFG